MFCESLAKAREVHEIAYRPLEYLYRNGARIGMGTDLFEERFAHMQNQEFSFRADIVKPIDLLRSATSINAEIMQKVGQLGCVAPGAYADLLVVNGNPLHDIHLMSAPERNRSEEHTSELQSLMRTSYAVFCLKNKNDYISNQQHFLSLTITPM